MTNRKPDGYTTAGEAARVREGKTGVVQGEPVRDPAVAVYFDEPPTTNASAPAYGVKEAGWISWTGGECPVPDCTEGLLRVADGEAMLEEFGGVLATLDLLAMSLDVDLAEATAAEFNAVTIRLGLTTCLTTPTASTIPSEPEAKGEAGAGPVGEAVAWAVYRDGACIAVRLTREDAWQFAQPNGDQDVRPLYAVPVEEPGEVERADPYPRVAGENMRLREEVERLTREWDDAVRRHLVHYQRAERETARADTAEAALAETRERLGDLEAVLRPFGFIADTERRAKPGDSVFVNIDLCRAARAALSTQESSAALAGDGKEVAR